MNSVKEYMVNKNKTLANYYRTPDGNSCESCVLIAFEIANLLLKEDKSPYIMYFRAKDIEKSSVIPKLFNGKVTWRKHFVCCESNVVYDPLLNSSPTPIESYSKLGFQEEIVGKIIHDKSSTIEQVKHYNLLF